jgi:hypothetical protein
VRAGDVDDDHLALLRDRRLPNPVRRDRHRPRAGVPGVQGLQAGEDRQGALAVGSGERDQSHVGLLLLGQVAGVIDRNRFGHNGNE